MDGTQPVFLQEAVHEIPGGAPFWMNTPLREEPEPMGIPAAGSGAIPVAAPPGD